MRAGLRSDCGADDDPAESRSHSRGGAVDPELSAGGEAPVPRERMACAPGVLLATGRGLQTMNGSVDLDRA
jgi:hypothetical protein